VPAPHLQHNRKGYTSCENCSRTFVTSLTFSGLVSKNGSLKRVFICGNSEPAKQEVSSILDQFGWEVEDMGTAQAARAIEPLCMLWCILGFRKNQWSHAFKLLKK
jgi:predicted dinucleotide-binding enzyme